MDEPSGCVDVREAYALGLWCADGYWWSSSIGLTNTEPELILRFAGYLSGQLPADRLKLRVYVAEEGRLDSRVMALVRDPVLKPPYKMGLNAYQLYVNSRPLLRRFRSLRSQRLGLLPLHVGAFFGGRLDGDGVLGSTPRICYSSRDDAVIDARMLAGVGVVRTSILRYRTASEYVLYVWKASQPAFRSAIRATSRKARLEAARNRSATSLSGL